jgi:hypothetical protein
LCLKCLCSGRSLFSDASRPLSRRYMGLVEGRTVDVMERWQYGLLRTGQRNQHTHALPSLPKPNRGASAPAGLRLHSRGACTG